MDYVDWISVNIIGDSNSMIFRCCIDGLPASPVNGESSTLKDMTLNEKIKYYSENNTSIFIVIIAILSLVIIALIVGFILYIKKLNEKPTNNNEIESRKHVKVYSTEINIKI